MINLGGKDGIRLGQNIFAFLNFQPKDCCVLFLPKYIDSEVGRRKKKRITDVFLRTYTDE